MSFSALRLLGAAPQLTTYSRALFSTTPKTNSVTDFLSIGIMCAAIIGMGVDRVWVGIEIKELKCRVKTLEDNQKQVDRTFSDLISSQKKPEPSPLPQFSSDCTTKKRSSGVRFA